MTGAWTAFGPRGFVPLLVVAGIYLLGPLWTKVGFTVDTDGVERRTPFGARRWTWDGLATYRIDPALRSAWITPKGRGTARFLPPVLLLWEPGDDAPTFAADLETRLSAHLPGRSER